MKKLKKGLSLLLVLAMVFSLATTAFAGWDVSGYGDADEITQDEAVAVMTGLGIIEGNENTGLFEPTGNYTREQAAKVLTYMLLGTDAAKNLTDVSTSFTDVSADRWSAKYISYLTSEGIIEGYGDGTFRPEVTLTRAAWLKMLLCAMGYDADKYGMGDDANWAAKAQALAVKSKLITGKELALDWDRETAVYYAFVAVQNNSNLVDKNDETAPFLVEIGNTDLHGEGNDAYGRPVTYYSTSGLDKAYAVATAEPELVIENGSMTNDELLEALGLEDGEEQYVSVTVYEDGKNSAASTALYTSGAYGDSVGEYGQTVEIYNTTKANAEHNSYTFVVINTYVAEIGEIAEGATTVSLGTVNGEDITTPVGDLKEGDVVSFNVCEDITTTATDYIAENVTVLEGTEGKITAKGATYVRVDGEKAYPSFKLVNGMSGKGTSDLAGLKAITGAATFYYDAYGNILYVADPAEEDDGDDEVEVDGYAYVVDSNYAPATGTAAFNNVKAPTETVQIVDLASGETDSVQRAFVYGGTGKAYYLADANGDKTDVAAGTALTAGFYGYYVLDDGSFVFDEVTTTKTSQYDAVVTTGKALVLNDTTHGYANANTALTYVVVSGEEGEEVYTTKTVTGIANFPTITSAKGNDISWAIVAEDSVIEKIFVVVTGDATVTPVAGDEEEPATVYGVYKSTGEYNVADETYAYTFVVDGVETVYYGKNDVDFESAGENVVYVITVDDDGYLTTTATPAFSDGKLVSANVLNGVADSYVIKSTGDVVYKANTCTVYDATEEQCGLVKGATVDLCLDSYGNIVYIVITAKPDSAS
jgi:hypothetical protein